MPERPNRALPVAAGCSALSLDLSFTHAKQRAPSPAIAALLVCAIFAFLDWSQGYKGLVWGGDNDSILRMVEVRDFMAGQGWFDLTQYRMGPEGGFVMHWSRLVDAPIAALAALFGERAALILWPLFLLGLAMYFIARAARVVGGDEAILPAGIIALATLWTIGQFDAGSIDHHNVQFVLTVAALAFLLESPGRPVLACAAGAASGLSMGVGMEAAPYFAVAGLVPAIWFLLEGKKAAPAATWYGLGFTGMAALIFFGTVGSSFWGVARCDAFSLPHLVVAIFAGLGLAGAATLGRGNTSFAGRAALLMTVGAAVVVALGIFFPECIAAPYSDLDPRQKLLWLNNVSETMPFWTLVQLRPAFAVGVYVTPMLALGFCAWMLFRRERVFPIMVAGGFLLAATITAFWQVRGSIFALGLATIPLAAWVASWRSLAAADAPGARVKLLLTLLLSMNMTWAAGAQEVAKLRGSPLAAENPSNSDSECHSEKSYRPILSVAPTTVLSDINGGAAILIYSKHRVLTGPYHRNPGNLVAYDIQTAKPEDARQILSKNGVGLITVCVENDETPSLTRQEPDGLHARLIRNDPPAWLHIVPGTETGPLRAYRVDGVEG